VGFFTLPEKFWICEDCGARWAEDNPKKCIKCKSKHFKEDEKEEE
jgi:rubrerythrin